MADELGCVPTADDLNAPLVLTIPYDEETLASYGLTEDDIQAVYLSQDGLGWEMVDDYVVDKETDQVAIFVNQLGNYALVGTTAYHRVYLPIVMRSAP